MQHEIISQVRDAEARAEQIVQAAHAEADRIARDARRQAVEQRRRIADQAKRDAKDRFERGVAALEPDIAAIRRQSDRDIAADAQRANAHFDAAVEYVVTGFYEQFGMDT